MAVQSLSVVDVGERACVGVVTVNQQLCGCFIGSTIHSLVAFSSMDKTFVTLTWTACDEPLVLYHKLVTSRVLSPSLHKTLSNLLE